MAKYKMICGDASEHSMGAGMIFTDPPYDMAGKRLADILANYDAQHLLLITSISQLVGLLRADDGWKVRFDFVLDAVVPKKSKSRHQPNYVHQTGVYLTKGRVKSAFDRRAHQRTDVFDETSYWPTIIRAPRDRLGEQYSKNLEAITNILGSFEVESVVDPFSGSFTTMLAAYHLGISCTGIEMCEERFKSAQQALYFVGCSSLETVNG